MTVFLLSRRNGDDYHVKDDELVGIFANHDAAVRKYEELVGPLKTTRTGRPKKNFPPLNPKNEPNGDWYEIDECPVQE